MSGSHSAAPRPSETNRPEPPSAMHSDEEILRLEGGKKYDWANDRAPVPLESPAPLVPPAPRAERHSPHLAHSPLAPPNPSQAARIEPSAYSAAAPTEPPALSAPMLEAQLAPQASTSSSDVTSLRERIRNLTAARRVITRDIPDVPGAPSLPPALAEDRRDAQRSALDTPSPNSLSQRPVDGDVSEQEKTNVTRVLRASTFRWMAILGVAGFVVGAVAGGWYASRMGYDARLTSVIGVLIGTAVGAAGMMIPPLFRAIGWGVLATAMGGVGAGALWILTKVAPALVERFLHIVR